MNPSAAFATAMMRINHWFQLSDGGEDRPRFYEVEAICPELRAYEANVDAIQQEFAAIDALNLPRLHETEPMHYCISAETENDWRVGIVYLCGRWSKGSQSKFPVTSSLLAETPGLVDAFFSVLDPGKTIPPHSGFYAGLLRYQVAVEVPSANPPTLWVDGTPHTWTRGEGILWDDTFTHSVTNESSERRVILIVDVKRPMRGLRRLVNSALLSIVGRAYAALLFRRGFAKDFHASPLAT